MNLRTFACTSAIVMSLGLVACDDDDAATPGGQTSGSPDSGTTPPPPTNNGNDGGQIAKMPRGKANRPTPGVQIDRMGRPAVATATIATFSSDDVAKGQMKDAYNAAAPASWATYSGEMKKSLAILDSLDGVCGNQLVADQTAERYAFLAGVLADDQLYVHSERGECGIYLGLEAEIVGAVGEGEGKCGGRTPTDDVIDRSYSVLAAGVLAGVDDGVTGADANADPNVFPFLGAPK